MVRTAEFQRAGFHNTYLAELTEGGRLIRVKAGLYIAAEEQTGAGFLEIQLALPNAVICLGSALAYCEMTTYEPPAVYIAIPRDDRTLAPVFPPIRRFSFGEPRYSLGVNVVEIEGNGIMIYDREKTICDAIRYRRVLGQNVTNEAVRNYLTSPGSKVKRVVEYARTLRVEGPVRTHLRLMV